MRSRLYECRVMHARTAPRRHSFVHRVFMLALDLDELETVHRATRLLSVNASNLYSLRESDYFPVGEPLHNPSGAMIDFSRDPAAGVATPLEVGPEPARGPWHSQGNTAATKVAPYIRPHESASDAHPWTSPVQSGANTPAGESTQNASLKHRVVAWLAEQGIDLAGGRVELVTMPRVAGYLFNPVSFYFCSDASGAPAAAIAEVTNTFREVKPFLLDRSTWQDGAFRLRVPKHFYVSPYSDVDVAFDFVLRPAGDRLAIQIDDYTDGERTLVSTLTGAPRPLTTRALAWFTIKHPLLTLGVMALIHVHALVLYLKRVPWFPKAARPQDQRNLHRPHPSLKQPRVSRMIP